MPTQEMPDKELDDLFREAAQTHTEAFEQEAWKRMEQLLDKHDGRVGGYWWKGVLLTILLLLVGTLGGWLLLESEKEVTTRSVVQPASGSNQAADDKATQGKVPEKRSGTAKSKATQPLGDSQTNPTVPTTAAQPNSGSDNSHRPQMRKADKQRRQISVFTRGETTSTSKPNKSLVGGVVGQAKQPIHGQETGRQNRLPDAVLQIDQADTVNLTAEPLVVALPRKASEADRLAGLEPLAGKGIAVAQPFIARPRVPPPADQDTSTGEDTSTNAITPAKEVDSQSRFSLGVMLSPDISATGVLNRIMPGTNVGVQVAYHLGNRLQLSIGAIYSVKLYTATVEDYHVPKGFWTYGVKPAGIEATCKVLDIPLQLRFDAWQGKRHRIFVSTGLSSYIMLSEQYNYKYNVYNSRLKPSWSGKHTGQYYFSVANASVGYERSMGRRFSWQIEPFLKLPLGGVGFGKVRLTSSGVFLAVKYRLGKKNL